MVDKTHFFPYLFLPYPVNLFKSLRIYKEKPFPKLKAPAKVRHYYTKTNLLVDLLVQLRS